MASEKLKVFLQAWLDWASQPKVEDAFHFTRNQGLCACLASFYKGEVEIQMELYALLEKDHKGQYQFPFENNKLSDYWQAKSKNALHKNPKRIAWVKKILSSN